MPADPRQFRLNSDRCLALAKRLRKPEAREVFTGMAATWNRLAAVAESDQTRFKAISEMELGGPDEDLPKALKFRLGEYA